MMKLLRVKASHFKNCYDGFTIDLTSKSKKTAEDIEYELQEIAPNLHVFNTAAFIGKNASGKTTAIELLDCAYSILGDFRLEDKHYSYDGVELEITFDEDAPIRRKVTILTTANGRYFGGGMLVSRAADITDGWFDTMLIDAVPRLLIPDKLVRFIKGTAGTLKQAHLRKCKKVIIRREGLIINADGELVHADEVTLEILPQALPVLF